MEFDTRGYWEARLRHFKGSLRSVGCNGLTIEGNALLYKRKCEGLIKIFDNLGVVLHDKVVLDGGCGIGYFYRWYIQQGASVIGIDPSPSAISYSLRYIPHGSFFQSSLEEFKHPDNTFDIVHVFDVLYHIINDDEWKDSLANIARLLKINGFFIFVETFPGKTIQKVSHIKHRSFWEYAKEMRKLKLEYVQCVQLKIKLTGGDEYFVVNKNEAKFMFRIFAYRKISKILRTTRFNPFATNKNI